MYSLVPRPHPRGRKRSGELWLNPRFSLDGAHRRGHAKLGSDWLLWLHLHVIATGDEANLEPDTVIGQRNRIYSLYSYTAMLHSCGKLICHVTEQSCDLIGMWKFLSVGPRILPKYTRPFSSLEMHGVWGRMRLFFIPYL